MVSRVVGSVAIFDANFGGAGQIVGTTKELYTPTNLPVSRRVRLHEQRTGRLVREAWSEPQTGGYAFSYLRVDRLYYVVAFDHTGAYGGVIETDITPEPMP